MGKICSRNLGGKGESKQKTKNKKTLFLGVDTAPGLWCNRDIKAQGGFYRARRVNRAERNEEKMKIYTAFTIAPADSGFGMWQRGEKPVGPQTSYACLSDLIMDGELIDLDAALADEDFIEAGIEDIRGRIYNEPADIYCVLGEEDDGSPCVRYFGVEEDEVPGDFFD